MNGTIEHDLPQKISITRKDALVPRRMILKRALAVGCGLLVPPLLMGCDSKQSDDTTGAAASGAPGTGADTSSAPVTPDKLPKANVQYQPQPRGEQQCSGCVHFIADSNTCKLVEGEISPEAWCTLWAPKA